MFLSLNILAFLNTPFLDYPKYLNICLSIFMVIGFIGSIQVPITILSNSKQELQFIEIS